MASGNGHLNSADVARILALVRNNGNGNGGSNQEPPANANEILQRAINELWARIQADSSGYIMNRYEFQLFNYYRERFGDSEVAKNAVARFWHNFRGDPEDLDGLA